MADPTPRPLTPAMLDLLESNFDGPASEFVYDRCGESLCENQDVRQLIAMARRAEAAERKVAELEKELTKSCVAVPLRGEKKDTCVYLRDGTKVLAQRDEWGMPFLIVEQQLDIRPAAEKP